MHRLTNGRRSLQPPLGQLVDPVSMFYSHKHKSLEVEVQFSAPPSESSEEVASIFSG